jgi:hypothetical protein
VRRNVSCLPDGPTAFNAMVADWLSLAEWHPELDPAFFRRDCDLRSLRMPAERSRMLSFSSI